MWQVVVAVLCALFSLVSLGVCIFSITSYDHWYTVGECYKTGITEINTRLVDGSDYYSFQLTYSEQDCPMQTTTFGTTDIYDITELFERYSNTTSFTCYASKSDPCDYELSASYENGFVAGIFLGFVCFAISIGSAFVSIDDFRHRNDIKD